MKNYVKPTVDVVELSVRENMAALPAGISDPTKGSITYNGVNYETTVYDLTSISDSANA